MFYTSALTFKSLLFEKPLLGAFFIAFEKRIHTYNKLSESA